MMYDVAQYCAGIMRELLGKGGSPILKKKKNTILPKYLSEVQEYPIANQTLPGHLSGVQVRGNYFDLRRARASWRVTVFEPYLSI